MWALIQNPIAYLLTEDKFSFVLDKFFNPRSVAVIGASHTPGKVGYVLAENFSRFPGQVYYVNPNPEPIFGKRPFPSVKSIKETVDFAVIAVKATLVPRVLKECVDKKIGAVVVISAGFSEMGEEGVRLEEQMRKIIRGTKTRLIGPNVIGIYDPASKVDTVFLPRDRMNRPKEGNIAFITQSGAVGSTIIDWMAEEGIGISKFVSYGNGMDVTEADLLEYLGDDPKTRVIAAYIEGAKSDGKKLISVLKKVCKKKPVIFLKSGKTKGGAHAAASHTGSVAGSSRVYSAVFKQFGAIEAPDWEELFDFAKAFAMQPTARGNRLLVVTNGGGFGVLAADEAEKMGVKLEPIPKQAVEKLRKTLHGYASLHNPLDLTGDSNAEMYRQAFENCISKYDGALLITLFQVPTLEESIVDIVAGLKSHGKPILCCAAGGKFSNMLSDRLEERGIPVYPTPERAVKAFEALARYGRHQRSA
jgi:acetyl coenzyme A synthetase (ADP forming)-like protein